MRLALHFGAPSRAARRATKNRKSTSTWLWILRAAATCLGLVLVAAMGISWLSSAVPEGPPALLALPDRNGQVDSVLLNKPGHGLSKGTLLAEEIKKTSGYCSSTTVVVERDESF